MVEKDITAIQLRVSKERVGGREMIVDHRKAMTNSVGE